MPNFQEHCKYTLERYGVDGASIHKWMDEPVKVQGPNHRQFRHTPSQKIPQFLVEEYGHSLARDIMIDHILLDSETPDGEYLIAEVPQFKLYEKIQDLERKNNNLKINFRRELDEIKQVLKINHEKHTIISDNTHLDILEHAKKTNSSWGKVLEKYRELDARLKVLEEVDV